MRPSEADGVTGAEPAVGSGAVAVEDVVYGKRLSSAMGEWGVLGRAAALAAAAVLEVDLSLLMGAVWWNVGLECVCRCMPVGCCGVLGEDVCCTGELPNTLGGRGMRASDELLAGRSEGGVDWSSVDEVRSESLASLEDAALTKLLYASCKLLLLLVLR